MVAGITCSPTKNLVNFGRVDFYYAGAVAKYCDEYVCVCLCRSVRKDTFATTLAIFTKFFVDVAYDCGSVLRGRRCDVSCTLPVLWMTLFFYSGPHSGMNFAT